MAKTCPNCGTQNRDMARFCQNCRQELEMICPNCGMVNASRANYCYSCGASFQTGSQPLAGGTAGGGGAAGGESLPGDDSLPGAVIPGDMTRPFTGLMPGTILDSRYCIEKRLGGGGMGAVYLALDQRLGKRWAIKEMSDAALTDPAERQHAVQAFENEARLLANLDHYNLPKVNNHFREDNKYYLVMDYIDGQTLDAMLEEKLNSQPSEPFSEKQVLKWAEELCSVLAYLHNQNPPIIFRDLKPGNIMVEKNGRLRLIDFGVARLFKPGKSKDTASFGTRGFAPYEQYGKDQTDARSDIYALGATMHYLLTLRDPVDYPFHFQPVRSLNPKVSKTTSDAIARAVNFERIDRWSTTGDFLKALKGSIPIPAGPAQAADPTASAFVGTGAGGGGVEPARLANVMITPPVGAAAATAANVGADPLVSAGQGPVAPPPAARVSSTALETVRRSNLLGYLFWVSLGIALEYLLITVIPFTIDGNDVFTMGMVITALTSFPQLISLLRTRLPGAFTLPILGLHLLYGSSGALIGSAFAGMVLAEFLLLIQSFNPNSFWRLFFVTLVAHSAAAFFENGPYNRPEYYLGIALGAACACIIGRVISNLFHWDS